MPAIADLLPHRPPMLWLDEVLEHGEHHIVCGLEVQDTPAYCDEGQVDCTIAVEWMAQAAGAFIGLRDRAGGDAPRPGFLIGAPQVTFEADSFSIGQRLRVEATHSFGDANLASFECRVLQGEAPLVSGTLTFFRPKRGEAWL